MAAQAYFSHNQLHKKNSSDKQEMLFQKGINWNDYPDFFKKGSYFVRKTTISKFTTEELEKLPPKHQARSNPDLMIVRSVIAELDIPPASKVTNWTDVLFNGQNPEVKTEEVKEDLDYENS